ncbi:hypothetical protein [Siccirubricoccus sp. G192]|uniref:hypothetical protein n=1 Tax=Siccirubricoccus sp. G192 TaxID=2849651 RepID=UPI001C2BC284|nr:hypothetical protein [Siccirubricoccus sp. G192]MBV1800232.1 hypothetical protein [Siccirubricoccus sp. G192]
MRNWLAVAALGSALALRPAPLIAQPQQVAVCPTMALVQQTLQNPGGPLPEGCRLVTVRRVDSPAGPLCAVDFSEEGQGLLGDIIDSAVQTRWWAACATLNLS